ALLLSRMLGYSPGLGYSPDGHWPENLRLVVAEDFVARQRVRVQSHLINQPIEWSISLCLVANTDAAFDEVSWGRRLCSVREVAMPLPVGVPNGSAVDVDVN